ncbi:MAG TPA: hypothetical protein VF817_05095 [Patescibacteria group bacterium]
MQPFDKELTIDENLWADFEELAATYMKLVPGVTFDDEDFWLMTVDLTAFFHESIGRMKEEKLKLGSETKAPLTDSTKIL